jgi:hypothetical protein
VDTYDESGVPTDEVTLILDQLARKYSATDDPERKRHFAIEMSKLSEAMSSIKSRAPRPKWIERLCHTTDERANGARPPKAGVFKAGALFVTEKV